MRNHTTSTKLLKTSIVGLATYSLSSLAATSFPGGNPITASDLTATPAVLPAAPPKYTTDAPISHKEYARFAWRQFIYYNSPAQKTGTNMPGVTPVVRGTISDQGNFVTSGKNDFYSSGKVAPQNFSSNILLWESFAHRVELFPCDPANINECKASGTGIAASGDLTTLTPEYHFRNVQVSTTQARFNNLDENSQIGLAKIFFPANGNTPSQNPYDDHEILFQAKVNGVEYDHVKSFGTTAPDSFELPPISGDTGESVEVKSAWRVLDSAMISSGRYHTSEAKYYLESCEVTLKAGEVCQDTQKKTTAHTGTFGLVGLHIIRKMENYDTFVYSTFEHVDNLKNQSGEETGLYFINLYTDLSYGGSEPDGKQPTVVLNTGPTRVTDTIPQAGPVTAANGYEFISGTYDLPANTTGPIKVVQPSTQTLAVLEVNNEVTAAMTASGQFSDSVWQYYRLKGIQAVPTDEDASVTSPENPLTQDFFLANDVIESTRPGVQLFKGGINLTDTTFTQDRSTKNILNSSDYPNNHYVMGGCMGCHGNAKYNNNGTPTSIFSFLVSKDRLDGKDRFDADVMNEADANLKTKAADYDLSPD